MKTNVLKCEIQETDFFKNSFRNERSESLIKFNNIGIPDFKNEEWKYSGIKKVINNSIDLKNYFFHDDNNQSTVKAENTIYIQNGKLLGNKIDTEGILIGKLTELESHSAVKKYFNTLCKDSENPFIHLNTAGFSEGIVIIVSEKYKSDNYFTINYSTTELIHDNTTQNRVLLVLNPNSNFHFRENYENETGFINQTTEIILLEGSQLHHSILQTNPSNSTRISQMEIEVNKNASYYNTTFTFTKNWQRNTFNAYLNGRGAYASFSGAYYCHENGLIDNHILTDHKQPHCNSNQLFKGMLNHSSSAIFNGKIYVQQDAQKTNAFQSSKAVLLSDNATINSKPQLEILADDVKCSHGAAFGQLSEDELFYLKARGIESHIAKAMLLFAFINEVISQCDDKWAAEIAKSKLSNVLNIEYNVE